MLDIGLVVEVGNGRGNMVGHLEANRKAGWTHLGKKKSSKSYVVVWLEELSAEKRDSGRALKPANLMG